MSGLGLIGLGLGFGSQRAAGGAAPPAEVQNLYNHATQTGMASTADTTDYTFGTGMVFAVDMMVSSVSIYHPVSAADPGRTVALYTTGTERLVSKTGAAEASGAGWKKVTFDTPYFVKAGNKIIPSATVTVNNGYSYVAGGFNSAKVRGDITGLIKTDTDMSPGNGRYAIGTGLQYPDQSANGEEYYVDVDAYAASRPAIPAGYPTAANTGYTTSLSASGGITTSSNGQVIENLDISGGITINHANVIVRNCKITINDNLGSAIRINGGGTAAHVHHNEVYGGTGSYIGIFISAGTGCTVEYNNISRFENNIFVGGNATIQHNYLHDMFSSIGSPHYDGIECNGGSNITIYHNTIINDFTQTSAVMLDNADAGLSNITVNDNVIIGGAYALYCDGHFAGGAVTGITITNNKVAPGFYGSFNFNSTTPTTSGNTNLYSGIAI